MFGNLQEIVNVHEDLMIILQSKFGIYFPLMRFFEKIAENYLKYFSKYYKYTKNLKDSTHLYNMLSI